jgi:hypothetical protein
MGSENDEESGYDLDLDLLIISTSSRVFYPRSGPAGEK